MSELSFVVFCITIVSLTAIVFGQNQIATKAMIILGKLFMPLFSEVRLETIPDKKYTDASKEMDEKRVRGSVVTDPVNE